MLRGLLVTSFLIPLLPASNDLEVARDRQDKAALQALAAKLAVSAQRAAQDAAAQARLAQARSYLAEVALELRDKGTAHTAAAEGIQAAQRAVELKPEVAEYHRTLGTLCGQAITANTLEGLKWGKCARDEINKAIELDPGSAASYLSRAVGNHYLPPFLGGGDDVATRDLQKALQLDPKLADAHLWMGIVLRKENRNTEARKELERALQLNPSRVWAKQQLDKTPTR